MSYAPGSPAEIWAVDGISDGAKLTIMWWWGRADHAAQQDTRRCTVWAPAYEREDGTRMTPTASLIEDLRRHVHRGKADRTIRHYIEEIEAAGLAIVDGRCVDLVPPSEAVKRQKSANPRPKYAARARGRNQPTDGQNLPHDGKNQPTDGQNLPPQLTPPEPPNFPQDPPTLGEPSPAVPADQPTPSPPQIASSPPPVSESGDDRPPPSPSPEARKRKPPKPRQRALDLPDPEPIDPLDIAHSELLAEHERLRAEAYAHHGERMPAWPGPLTQSGKAIRVGLRQALRDHGVEACRSALAIRAAEWRRDASKLSRFSTASMWSVEGLRWALPASARASPAGPGNRQGRGGVDDGPYFDWSRLENLSDG